MPTITKEQRNRKVLRPIHANQAVRFRYQRQLLALIDEMAASVSYWVQATYNQNESRVAELAAHDSTILSFDATPSAEMNKKLKELAKKWREKFDLAAPKIAEAYLKGNFKATNSAMQAALKDVGFSIKFKMTPAMRDALNASLDENVGLIKSIPEQYLLDVQGIISRAYTRGENLQELIKRIKKVYPKAANRAAVIARDQSNKASAVMLRIRHMEIGITRAIWKHSHGGKTPRPDHVKADGREYDIVKGCLISGEYIQPGQLINCRCVNRVILPSLQKR